MRKFFQTEFIKYMGIKGFKPIEYMNSNKIPKLYHIVDTTHYGFLSVMVVRESITYASDRFTMPIQHIVIPTSEHELDGHIDDVLSKIKKNDLFLVSDIEIKTSSTLDKLVNAMDNKDLPFFNVFSYDGDMTNYTKIPAYARLNGPIAINVLASPVPAISIIESIAMLFNINTDGYSHILDKDPDICLSVAIKGKEMLSIIESYMKDRDNKTVISKICYDYPASTLIKLYTTIGEDSPIYFNKDSRVCFNMPDTGKSEPVDIMSQLDSLMEVLAADKTVEINEEDEENDTYYKNSIIRFPNNLLD